MKILVISHEFPPIGGGGANACYFLTKEYVKLGHEVVVVTAAYRDLPVEETIDGVKVIRVKAKREKEDKSTFLEMFSYLFSAYIYTDKLCKTEKFDACQVFFGIPSGPIGVHLKKKYKIPYIVRFGGGDIPGAQKRFALIYKILTPFTRQIWREASALVANSEVLKQKAQAFESKYPIEIIPNGVDSEFFTSGKIEVKNSDIYGDSDKNILFVSRLIKGKGLQHIIPRMQEVYEKTGAKLTIVGDGPYREELEKITRETGNSQYVSFVGKKNKLELYPYYDQADLFILPSESEGMPNVVLEAMSMGCPIVMTPCGGSKELIDNNGKVVEIDIFVDEMISMFTDGEKLKDMGAEGSRIVRDSFSWSQKASLYVQLISKIIQG